VPVGGSDADAISLGGSDGVAGATEVCGGVFDDRRQRLKNPNMRVPANHWRRSTAIDAIRHTEIAIQMSRKHRA